MSDSWIEESRSDWSTPDGPVFTPGDPESGYKRLQIGCLQRIATALERIAESLHPDDRPALMRRSRRRLEYETQTELVGEATRILMRKAKTHAPGFQRITYTKVAHSVAWRLVADEIPMPELGWEWSDLTPELKALRGSSSPRQKELIDLLSKPKRPTPNPPPKETHHAPDEDRGDPGPVQ